MSLAKTFKQGLFQLGNILRSHTISGNVHIMVRTLHKFFVVVHCTILKFSRLGFK